MQDPTKKWSLEQALSSRSYQTQNWYEFGTLKQTTSTGKCESVMPQKDFALWWSSLLFRRWPGSFSGHRKINRKSHPWCGLETVNTQRRFCGVTLKLQAQQKLQDHARSTGTSETAELPSSFTPKVHPYPYKEAIHRGIIPLVTNHTTRLFTILHTERSVSCTLKVIIQHTQGNTSTHTRSYINTQKVILQFTPCHTSIHKRSNFNTHEVILRYGMLCCKFMLNDNSC